MLILHAILCADVFHADMLHAITYQVADTYHADMYNADMFHASGHHACAHAHITGKPLHSMSHMMSNGMQDANPLVARKQQLDDSHVPESATTYESRFSYNRVCAPSASLSLPMAS